MKNWKLPNASRFSCSGFVIVFFYHTYFSFPGTADKECINKTAIMPLAVRDLLEQDLQPSPYVQLSMEGSLQDFSEHLENVCK